MKTIEEFINEIGESAELQNEIIAIKNVEGFEELLKKNGVCATTDEFAETMGEISDDDAEAVAGGKLLNPWQRNKYLRELLSQQPWYQEMLVKMGLSKPCGDAPDVET